MLRNYLIIAWRNIKRQKIFSFINVFGLAIGLCASLLIIVFIADEYQANNWIRNVNSQYMLESDWDAGINRPAITTLAPLGKALKDNYPHLVANYFSIDALSCNVSDGNTKSFRMNLQLGKGPFIDMFRLPLLHGDPQSAFNDMNDIVIQKDVALKFFGRTDVIGKSLLLETQNANHHPKGYKEYMISGVIDDLPVNSITDNLGSRTDVYINADNILFFRSFDVFDAWDNYIIQTRIELQKGVNSEDLIIPMEELIKKNAPSYLADQIQPRLTSIRSYNLTDNNNAKQKLIITLSLVAFFILLMAMINFMNISLGMAQKRMREIGVRKAIGGRKKQLMVQFMAESVLLAFIASLLALCLVQLALPYYINILNKQQFSNVHFIDIAMFILPLALLTGFIAGSYPAFILSGQPAVKALKGKMNRTKKQVDLRRVLLSIQFMLALFFLVSTVTIFQQVDYMLDKDTGYDSENIFVASSVPRWYSPEGVSRILDIKESFKAIPGVTSVSLSYEIPDGRHGTQISLTKPDEQEFNMFGVISCDADYMKTYGLQLERGRFFNDQDVLKSRILLNTSAAQSLFGDQQAIGELLIGRDALTYEVIGVVKDFHFGSLHDNIKGIVFSQIDTSSIFRYLSFKVNDRNVHQTASAISEKWSEIFPLVPFEHFYMKGKLRELYKTDTQFRKALITASAFAFFIVLIGLFGITIQNMAYRTKEIAIRKVLGASARTIWKLMSREQVIIYLISATFALPVAYLITEKWLNNFAYRIEQPVWQYPIVCLFFLVIALLTISLELLKATRINPADNLKNE